ncbi:MAG TPA: lysylphosphatidylglycerol synthase transmembrane domain-containing protein [Methanosarcina sp.]|nr:lysylphosphatidylglycerol synthase transmembrane domain-containing protein [Methanosarcina sp.]
MNLGILKKVVATILLLTVGVFLIRAYWTEIVPALGESLKMLTETRIQYVILAFLVYLLSVYLFAVRWQRVLYCIGYTLKATDLFPILFGAIFVNNLTPANRTGGEPLRIFWANKRFGISYTDAFITIFFERLVEAIPIILLLFYVLYLFPSLEIKFLPQKSILTLNSTYLLLLTFLATGVLVWIFRERFTVFLKDIQQNWKKLNRSFIPVLLFSCWVWILDIIRLKLIALALNIPLSLYIISAVSILYLLLGLLPVTPGGIGIVEGGLISLLLYFGLTLASAGSFIFLERFISYGLSSLIGFLYLFYYGGFKIWKNTKSH